ncbi:MAG: tRNA (adenosine(37)-N6)-threonylcarbamoyltransferase complex transferase subunit TsaD [Lachnospiraceae bacterium]|nr:tRNA (adenosine(37)-N6)-threonylcarbamoyltransferase complex transferase subunit TsaD [Lachnospiraceae bacterium]
MKTAEESSVTLLAIESSCDETAAAVVRDGRRILSDIIYSQIKTHTLYGGVVPEIASRQHVEKISICVRRALDEAGLSLADMDGVAVTCGPGLVGALLVGVSFAKAAAYSVGLPLIGVHHIDGHISALYLEKPELQPPFLCLVASGGHSHLVLVRDYGIYEILGQTRDDAAGEAFDKVARALGLPYPGGPSIDRAAAEGDPHAYDFPQAKIDGASYDFSFSGLKSAVLNELNRCQMSGESVRTADIAASFQRAVVEVLVEHLTRAAEEFGMKTVAIAGGVASNSCLRRTAEEACGERGLTFICPGPRLCTDNAAMIGSAGYYAYIRGVRSDLSLNAQPNLPLGTRERRYHANLKGGVSA